MHHCEQFLQGLLSNLILIGSIYVVKIPSKVIPDDHVGQLCQQWCVLQTTIISTVNEPVHLLY